MEHELLFSGKVNAASFVHPAILLPLSGQILLLVSLLQKSPGRWLTLTGIALTSLLVLIILLAGLLAKDLKMIVSCLPFVIVALLYVLRSSRIQKQSTS
jgi:hypothetical protein